MARSLTDQILQEIKVDPQQRISFRRYMELALYHPHLGYYRRSLPKIGKEGDFYTSPKVGEVFGWSLAQAMARMADTFPPDTHWVLIEAGAGDGTLARQVIQSLAEHEQLPSAFYLMESSYYHRKRLEELAGSCPVPLRLVNGVTEIPAGKSAILYSNELLDALPVHRVISDKGSLWELYVTQEGENSVLTEVQGPLSRPELESYFRELKWQLPEGWTAEVPLDALEWLEKVGNWLEKGYLITLDYGGTVEELSRPERKRGTLRCYREHRLHRDFYRDPGFSDMTSHVHFTALMERGKRVGLETLLYTDQSHFLQGAGIFKRWTPPPRDPFSPEARRNRAIRHLAVAGGMGDAFQVLIQSKGIARPVTGVAPKSSGDDT